MTLIAKPFITILGDEFWCDQIVSYCVPNLPMEPTEWVRRKGSGFKLVHVDIDTKDFYQNKLIENDNSILGSPLLHIFVIIENEEIYNNKAKTKFGEWIGFLRSRSIENWKLIIVPDGTAKPKSKFALNKFIMLSKIKTDFNLQKIENYAIRLSDNARERFNQIQKFLRETILNTYDDKCYKIEDKIRIQRETRFTFLWNYFDYFYLQEELADIYECLNLYEESLAQFDESDAVFSKCLDSFHKGENASWIINFKQNPFNKIDCLILTNYSDPEKRFDLAKGHLCLADFRAYLLSRQCALLQLLNRYQEIPSLVYTTLLKFLNECKLLKLDVDVNLNNCWIFLTALQALQRFSPIDCEELLAQDYAALFRLALNSINKLAISLNIWISSQLDWSPIEILREKLSILGNDEFGDTPSSRLAAGFKSQLDFQEFHCKLFEEAIMIWKHIGRIRSANLLGIQLADLYYKIQQFDKAEPLYIKAIKCLRNENWAHLAMPLRLKLAVCQKDKFENDPEKYLKTCIHLAGATFSSNKSSFNPDLSLKNNTDHKFYFTELNKCVSILYDKTRKPQKLKMEPLFSLSCITLLPPDDQGFQIINIIMDSYLPQSINVKFSLYGKKFPELDLTNSHNGNKELDISAITNMDLLEFPAQYSIPLNSAPSPKIYRIDKNVCDSKNIRKEFHCQSSVDEELSNINYGVSVEILDVENASDECGDKLVSLICFPKIDAGLKARKTSLSQDVGISMNSPILINVEMPTEAHFEKGTIFYSIEDNVNLTIIPGKNEIKLKSQEYGLYIPVSIEISIFEDECLVKDCINSNDMDNSWSDIKTIETYLPNIIIDKDLDNYGFINFKNQINPQIKMGKLAYPANEIELKIQVNNENEFSIQKVNIESKESNILLPRKIFSLCDLLDYNLKSMSDKVIFSIPGLLKKELPISFFENIHLSKDIIQTSSSKYVISVGLQRPNGSKIRQCDYQIKNPSLKLHHQNEIRQLLPLAHHSLARGMFNDQTQFTILWVLENIDIVNFDKDCLRFTLSIDLSLEICHIKQLTGTIVHDFELRNN